MANSSSVFQPNFSATSLSPHGCTVGPSSRVWMVLHPGPSSLGTLSSVVSLFVFPCPVYRRMFDTPPRKGYTSFLVFNCLASCSCFDKCPVFISSSHLVPETPAVVPAPHVFPPCVVVRVAFHFNCFCGLPPFRAAPSEHLLQGINHRIWPFTTDPSHGSPHVFDNPF